MELDNEEMWVEEWLKGIYKKFIGKSPKQTDSISAKIRNKTSYALGVASEYISRKKVRNFQGLVRQTLEHREEHSPLKMDLNREIKDFYDEFVLI